MTKKYLRLSCTVCRRKIDKLVNLTHYTPDRCTITLGCEGRLQPLEYVSSGGIAVAPEIGVTDWRARGTTVTGTYTDTDPTLISLETGPTKQIVLAVPYDAINAVLGVTIKSDAPKDYRQYVYRKDTSFSSISGVESGLEKKALRFTAYGTNPDQVEVYVDGVKKEQGTGADEYMIYQGSDSSSVPPNTVSFNTVIDTIAVAQVDVIVSKQVAATTMNLTFGRNVFDESRTGAYENVSSVDRLVDGAWKRYYLYTVDLDSVSIPLNSILYPTSQDAFFMLARKPFSQLDRYYDSVVLLQGLSQDDYLKFYVVSSAVTLQITDTAITTFFPPLRINKFTVEKTIRTALAGVTEQLVLDGKVITGPDA